MLRKLYLEVYSSVRGELTGLSSLFRCKRQAVNGVKELRSRGVAPVEEGLTSKQDLPS